MATGNVHIEFLMDDSTAQKMEGAAEAAENLDLVMTKGYARILALATTDALTNRFLQPDDVEVVAYALAKLGHLDQAATLLIEYGLGEYDIRVAMAEAQAMARGERGEWGYTPAHFHHEVQRYHVCGKAFTVPAEDGEPAQVMDCTEDYGHEGACSQ